MSKQKYIFLHEKRSDFIFVEISDTNKSFIHEDVYELLLPARVNSIYYVIYKKKKKLIAYYYLYQTEEKNILVKSK